MFKNPILLAHKLRKKAIRRVRTAHQNLYIAIALRICVSPVALQKTNNKKPKGSGFALLIALSFAMGLYPWSLAAAEESAAFSSFAEWCLNRETLPSDAEHTVEVLLRLTGTNDCAASEEKLSNLTGLSLSNNRISNLSPLSSLKNVTSLSLSKNEIIDIAPVAALKNLTWLNLSQNQISDLTPLSKLKNLTSLSLSNNQISDLTPLKSLKELNWLSLSQNQIADIKPLSKLKNLTSLNLNHNQISDISQLQSLENLTKLHLRDNQIADIEPLSSLKNLTYLELQDNPLASYSCPLDPYICNF